MKYMKMLQGMLLNLLRRDGIGVALQKMKECLYVRLVEN